VSEGGGFKAIIAAMSANAGIAIAKFVAFLFTSSASMLAESIHSLADTSNQALMLLGRKRAQMVADDRHQFGYGRERYFWAFIVAMVLFTLGGLYSIYEGISKIRHPHEVTAIGWAIGVLVVAMALEGYSFRTAYREASEIRGNRGWWRYIRSSRSPELPVVLMEDSGALVGLVLALIGVGLSALTGNVVWDAIGTLSIGILLLTIAIILVVEMKSLLIGEAATDEHVEALRKAVTDTPGVNRIIDLRTQHIGPEELLVAAKVDFDHSFTTQQVARAVDDVERAIRGAVPMASLIYLEPDLWDPNHTPNHALGSHRDKK
jgi:cation diffusion facilitator family transporter